MWHWTIPSTAATSESQKPQISLGSEFLEFPEGHPGYEERQGRGRRVADSGRPTTKSSQHGQCEREDQGQQTQYECHGGKHESRYRQGQGDQSHGAGGNLATRTRSSERGSGNTNLTEGGPWSKCSEPLRETSQSMSTYTSRSATVGDKLDRMTADLEK